MTQVDLQKPISLSFSQRNGYSAIPSTLKPGELTSHLRNELCAALREAIDNSAACKGRGVKCYETFQVANWEKALHKFWVSKLGFQYEQFNPGQCLEYNCLPIIKNAPCNVVFDLVENLLNLTGEQQPSFPIAISEILHTNQAPYLLKQVERSTWWVIQTGISYERKHVLEAFSCLQDPTLKYVREHLEKSGHELTKGNPVLSAEESLKALEACARFIGSCPNKSGGDALKECAKIYSIPFPLYKSVEYLWIYRNDASGVGHSLKDGAIPPPNEIDGQLIYVACCGFISYLLNQKNSK